jgi:iron complex transport system permease protein
MNQKQVHAGRAIAVLAIGTLLACAAALLIGSVDLAPSQLAAALLEPGGASEPRPLAAALLALRLPRALTALAVGGLLGLSGGLLQALLRNPLADPYVLGISGGAACAALAAIALGWGALAIEGAAAAGAALTLAALFVLARRALFTRDLAQAEHAGTAILLNGVMIASLSAAILSLALSLAPDGRLRTMVFWLLGDLGGAASLAMAALGAAVWFACVIAAARDGRALNLMLRGDLQAFTQGVRIERVRRRQIALAALATGCAVALAGAIGFVGFVAPHLVRRFVGNDQRVVLPAASLAGAILVVLADTAARSVAAPLQLPVGVVTVMIGVPVFLWQLQRA